MTGKVRRCAVYTRKSSEEGLDQSFNSLDAQREACEAYIKSQAHEGWKLVKTAYDDGGFSGGSMDRPALQRLLADLSQGLVDVIVVYKIDRLTRSLADFARIVETLDRQGASFVSITQQFNTTTSMGRLTLNVLLSFAQFEREVTGERIRDKIAASKRRDGRQSALGLRRAGPRAGRQRGRSGHGQVPVPDVCRAWDGVGTDERDQAARDRQQALDVEHWQNEGRGRLQSRSPLLSVAQSALCRPHFPSWSYLCWSASVHRTARSVGHGAGDVDGQSAGSGKN